MEEHASSVRLTDGRTLAYAEFGSKQGRPVFYFHGGGSSSFEAALYDRAATALKVRLIAVDRPGIGLSDFKKNRRLLDWADDVNQLADHLNLERFAVFGLSGGAPYALACAYVLSHRITGCAVVSGMVPRTLLPAGTPLRFRSVYWAGALRWLYRPVLSALRPLLQSPARVEWLLGKMTRGFSAADRQALESKRVRRVLAEAVANAARQGGLASLTEILINTGEWGFHLHDLPPDIVHLWHGRDDTVVPIAMAQSMAKAIPSCRAIFIDGEGHLSVPINYAEIILIGLVNTPD